MTIKVTLYENAIPDNNRNSICACLDINLQKAYFDSLNKIELNADRFTWKNPFIVLANLGSLWKYQYGSYEYEGKRYYFSVDEINPVNDTKSEIVYRIDWLETLKYELTFNSSYIFSSNKELKYTKAYYELPPDYYLYNLIKTFDIDFSVPSTTSLSEGYLVVFILHCSNEEDENALNKDIICFCKPKSFIINPRKLFRNICNTILISEDINIGDNPVINKASDIYGMWILPYNFILDTGYFLHKLGNYLDYYYIDITYGATYDEQRNIGFLRLPTDISILLNNNIPSNQLVFIDNFGSIIWELPYNTKLGEELSNLYLYFTYNINFSQLTLKLTLQKYNETDYRNPSQYSFTYIPIALDTTTDAYQDYVYLQRQLDIDLRNLNMNKNLVKGIGSSLESAMFGGLMGGLFGRDLGVKKGLAVGGIGSIISTFTDYLTELYFSPIEQKIIDKVYARLDDSISLGSLGAGFLSWGYKCGFYTRKYDDNLKSCFDEQKAFYGYKYNQLVTKSEMQEVYNKCISENYFSHLKLDVTFIKNYNDEIRKQIHLRLYNGVSFNKLTTGDNND